MRLRTAAFLCCLFLPTSSVHAEPVRYHVRSDAAPGGSGASWSEAFATIGEALVAPATAGAEIWVAGGIYEEETLTLVSGAGLYGGFEGTETSLEERDPVANETVIDATGLEGTAIVAVSIRDATLDGLLLRNGSWLNGAAITALNSSLNVSRCVFENNHSDEKGGAVYAAESNISLIDCVFKDNSCEGQGGGFYVRTSDLSMKGCLFQDNAARNGGGAMACVRTSGIVDNATFAGNSSEFSGGGAIFWDLSLKAELERCSFHRNEAYSGGAASIIRTTAAISDCTFSKNLSEYSGGALLGLSATFQINRSLFEENKAPLDTSEEGDGSSRLGGAMYLEDSEAFVSNSEFYRNVAGTGASAIHFFYSSKPAVLVLEDTRIEHNLTEKSSPETGVVVLPYDADVTAERSVIANNTAPKGSPNFLPDLHALGPPIAPGPFQLDRMVIRDTVISNNTNMSGIQSGTIEITNSVVSGHAGEGVDARSVKLADCDISENGIIGVRAVEATIRKSRIVANGTTSATISSQNEGGVFTGGSSLLDSCLIQGNSSTDDTGAGVEFNGDKLTMINCVVAGNTSVSRESTGGGVGIDSGGAELFNCVFEGNRAISTVEGSFEDFANGILLPWWAGGDLTLTNTIVWDATQPVFAGFPFERSITHSNLSVPFEGEGNISEDPLFFQPWDGQSADLRLACDSPSVDTGTAVGAPPADIDGVLRPKGGGIDMGAYENCATDLNGDGVDGADDLLYFPLEWYGDATGFDFVTGPSGRTRVDALDLLELLESWKR